MNRRNFIKNIIATVFSYQALPSLHLIANESSTIVSPVDYLYKMEHFDSSFADDYILPASSIPIFLSLTRRLTRFEQTIGHANFMIIHYNSAIAMAKKYPYIGAFTSQEESLMHSLFEDNPAQYGFMGERTVNNITYIINNKDVLKIPHTGNYLFRDVALSKWKTIQKILNNQVILTSGVRNVIKQMHLFCKKTVANNYNISLASRSLAPAGYSFHSIGDFDVGKPGFGLRNFTKDFLYTQTYARLVEAGVLDLRYYDKNSFGVRFEPWHVKV